MSNIIRFTVAVEVPEGVNAAKIAQELRNSTAGKRVQNYVTNIVIPDTNGEEYATLVQDEVLIHNCEWYDVDECSVCRHASSYALQVTHNNYF